MKTTTKLLALLIALAACGDNKGRADAHQGPDGPPADAQCSNCPAAPTLGTQIDRMGRPAINTLLNRFFESPTVGQGTAKDAYNMASDPTMWVTANEGEFKKNLGILDALDFGVCGNGLCEVGEFGANGTTGVCPLDCPGAADVGTVTESCGNQVLYNGGAGGAPATDSYKAMADVLAADELWLDTTKTDCEFYLAVEFGFVLSHMPTGGNMTCGGRAPQYDVVDFSLSAIALGISGFSTDGRFIPKFKDNAPPHTDYLPVFPYLGEPHNP
jgi:hypothetical protein